VIGNYEILSGVAVGSQQRYSEVDTDSADGGSDGDCKFLRGQFVELLLQECLKLGNPGGSAHQINGDSVDPGNLRPFVLAEQVVHVLERIQRC